MPRPTSPIVSAAPECSLTFKNCNYFVSIANLKTDAIDMKTSSFTTIQTENIAENCGYKRVLRTEGIYSAAPIHNKPAQIMLQTCDFESNVSEAEEQILNLPITVDSISSVLQPQNFFFDNEHFAFVYEDVIPNQFNRRSVVLTDRTGNYHTFEGLDFISIRNSRAMPLMRQYLMDDTPMFCLAFDGSISQDRNAHLKPVVFDGVWNGQYSHIIESTNTLLAFSLDDRGYGKYEKFYAIDANGCTLNMLEKFPSLVGVKPFNAQDLFVHTLLDNEFCFTIVENGFATTYHVIDDRLNINNGFINADKNIVFPSKDFVSLTNLSHNSPVTEFFTAGCNLDKHKIVNEQAVVYRTDSIDLSTEAFEVPVDIKKQYAAYFYLEQKRLVLVHNTKYQTISSSNCVTSGAKDLVVYYNDSSVPPAHFKMARFVDWKQDGLTTDFDYSDYELLRSQADKVLGISREGPSRNMMLNSTFLFEVSDDDEFITAHIGERTVLIRMNNRVLLFILNNELELVKKFTYSSEKINGLPSYYTENNHLYILSDKRVYLVDIESGSVYENELISSVISTSVSANVFATSDGFVECHFNKDTGEITADIHTVERMPFLNDPWKNKEGYLSEFSFDYETREWISKVWRFDSSAELCLSLEFEDHISIDQFFYEMEIVHLNLSGADQEV
ncbi:hypothetical protein PCE1_001897 [Barthelona sp. PCE]